MSNDILPEDASLEDKINEMAKGDKRRPVYIGNKEEFMDIAKGVAEKRKIKLEAGKDYELQMFIDKSKQIAIYFITDIKTGFNIAEGWSGSPEPFPILRFRFEGQQEEITESREFKAGVTILPHGFPFVGGSYKKETKTKK